MDPLLCQNLRPQNVQMQVQKYVVKSPHHHHRVQVTIPMAMIMEMTAAMETGMTMAKTG
jgi:hypothetical protein